MLLYETIHARRAISFFPTFVFSQVFVLRQNLNEKHFCILGAMQRLCQAWEEDLKVILAIETFRIISAKCQLIVTVVMVKQRSSSNAKAFRVWGQPIMQFCFNFS